MAHNVFICHSSKDKLVADAACAALEAHRIPCWIAPRDILAGDEYAAAIIDALDETQIVLLIFSAHANDSTQVRREIERAVSKEKIIVPFRIEDVLPTRAMEFHLMNTHWLDALDPPMEQRLTELCNTISRIMQKQPQSNTLWQTTEPIHEDAVQAPEQAKRQLKSESLDTAITVQKRHFFRNSWTIAGGVMFCSLVLVFCLRQVAGGHVEPVSAPPPAIGSATTPPSSPASPSVNKPVVVPGPNHAILSPPNKALQQKTATQNISAGAKIDVPLGLNHGQPTSTPLPAEVSKAEVGKVQPKTEAELVGEQAIKLYEEKKYTDARPLLTRACSSGNAETCNDLGTIYENALGGTQNFSLAATLYTEACHKTTQFSGSEKDFAQFCNNSARMYETGRGVQQDYRRAWNQYLNVCLGTSEDGLSCSHVGKLTLLGLGHRKDLDVARLYLNRGCSRGDSAGCELLKHVDDQPQAGSHFFGAAIHLGGPHLALEMWVGE